MLPNVRDRVVNPVPGSGHGAVRRPGAEEEIVGVRGGDRSAGHRRTRAGAGRLDVEGLTLSMPEYSLMYSVPNDVIGVE